eukprot:m.292137 g.292137  ORF g.292137 m.292137 type:complete len:139 (+) comp17823_c0_seq1:11902-12318(+)
MRRASLAACSALSGLLVRRRRDDNNPRDLSSVVNKFLLPGSFGFFRMPIHLREPVSSLLGTNDGCCSGEAMPCEDSSRCRLRSECHGCRQLVGGRRVGKVSLRLNERRGRGYVKQQWQRRLRHQIATATKAMLCSLSW